MRQASIKNTLYISALTFILATNTAFAMDKEKDEKDKEKAQLGQQKIIEDVLVSEKAKKGKSDKMGISLSLSGSYADSRDSFILSKSRSKSNSGGAGISYRVNPKFNFGVNYGHNKGKSRGKLTRLTRATRGKSKSNSVFTFGALSFTKNISLNVVLGYSRNNNRNTVFNPGRAPTITPTKSNVYSFTPSLNFNQSFGQARAALAVGWGYSDSNRKRALNSDGRALDKSSSNSKTSFGLLDVSYNFSNVAPLIKSLTPYVQGGINYNFKSNPSRGPDGNFYTKKKTSVKVGAGLRVSTTNDVSVSLGWSNSNGYSGSRTNAFSLGLKTNL